jgi:hypothetical protein
MVTFYLDYENGNDNYGGTSFNVLASGSDGAITSTTFSSATANFPNDNTIAPLKNILWYTNFLYGYGSYNGYRLLNLDYYVDDNIVGPTGINSYIYYLQEYPNNTTRYAGPNTATNYTLNNNTNYTTSVYVKSNGRNKVILVWSNLSTKAARFNLSNGTVEALGANVTAANITSANDGWYRISLSVTSSASASTDNVSLATVTDDYTGTGFQTYDGDPTKGIYFTGMQIEASSSVTSYENPPGQILSIFNGTIYAYYHVIERLSSTSLRIAALADGGTALANTSGRQYFIGGRVQTFTNGLTSVRLADGDIIRVEASPDPTSIGSATWTGSGSPPTVTISSSTNATPISITTSAAHGYSTGDTVFICDHTSNTNANGTWEITVTGSTTFTLTGSTGNNTGGATGTSRKATNCVIRLASQLTENIASHGNAGDGRTIWTATATNSAGQSTTTKQGSFADNIVVGTGNGLIAYKSFSTKNLSGYQQLSFYIQQIGGTVATSGQIQLILCSDNAGVTAVNTFNVPALGALNNWHVFTIDSGVNLGSSIQSIALYRPNSAATQTFLLSNIIACKASSSANSLSLTSLIGKNTTNESWYPIQSIVGTRVIIDGRLTASNPLSTTQGAFTKGYYGATETITTYKRESIKTPPQSAATNGVHTINDSASHFVPGFVIEGGWNRTDMSTQTGITFFDGQNGLGYGINSSSRSSVSMKNLGFTRYDRVFVQNTSFSSFKNFYVIGCNNHFDMTTATSFCKFENVFCNNNNIGIVGTFGFNMNKFTNCYFLNNNLRGIDVSTFNNLTFNNCYWNNNGSFGFYDTGGGTNTTFNNCNFFNNQGDGLRTQGCSSNIILNNCSTSGNQSNIGLYSFGGSIYLNNCNILESSEVGFYSYGDGRIYSTNHDNTSGLSYLFLDLGLIRPQTSVRYTNSGFAWSMSPTSDYRRDNYPLGFPIAKVAVNANAQVIIKAWMRRSNIGLITRLRIKGGQIAGVANDVISYMTAVADTWEQVTLNFTPTEVGVVEILAECWGGSTYTGYVDDLTIIQA